MLCEDVGKHTVEICGECDPKTYPISKKFHGLEHLRKLAHLRPRTKLFGGVSRVRNALAFATHLFY